MKESKNYFIKALIRSTGLQKFFFSGALALLTFTLAFSFNLRFFTALNLSWDIFCILMIGVEWLLFYITTSKNIKSHVVKQDENIYVIFYIVLMAVIISFGSLFFQLTYKGYTSYVNPQIHFFISVLGIPLSWLLLNTIFTVHYAKLYFPDDAPQSLIIPGGKEPDYIDIAYFSFVIGMTFQVSDVQISSRKIRRFALLHSIIAFVFNTFIVALTINIIGNLK